VSSLNRWKDIDNLIFKCSNSPIGECNMAFTTKKMQFSHTKIHAKYTLFKTPKALPNAFPLKLFLNFLRKIGNFNGFNWCCEGVQFPMLKLRVQG